MRPRLIDAVMRIVAAAVVSDPFIVVGVNVRYFRMPLPKSSLFRLPNVTYVRTPTAVCHPRPLWEAPARHLCSQHKVHFAEATSALRHPV